MIALTRSMRHIKTSRIFLPPFIGRRKNYYHRRAIMCLWYGGAKKFKVLKLDYVLVYGK
jgi:hypothetical protein